jgi:hypothetical protein
MTQTIWTYINRVVNRFGIGIIPLKSKVRALERPDCLMLFFTDDKTTKLALIVNNHRTDFKVIK